MRSTLSEFSLCSLHLINDFGANGSLIFNGCHDVTGNPSQALNKLCKQTGKNDTPAGGREERKRNGRMSSEVRKKSSGDLRQTERDKNTMTPSLSCAVGLNSIYLVEPCKVSLFLKQPQCALDGVNGTFMALGELRLLGNT